MLAMPAQRVSRCPRALPPEGGASLPHCGSLALHNLQITGLNVHTAKGKRVLIVGAGSGSGCVMLQLLKAWGATTTSVCDPRARPLVTALGSQEVLTVDWCADDGIGSSKEANAALAEALSVDLRQFEPWDVICICRAPPGDLHLRPLLRVGGFIADLRSSHLYTDSLPSVLTSFYGFYITARRMFQVYIYQLKKSFNELFSIK